MSLRAATPLPEILETDWDATLFRGPKALANMLGWTSYHTLRSKGSKPGYPDRTLVKDRIIFAELKRELTGKKSEDANRQPTPAQIDWLDKLAEAGGEVYLWRPSDLQEIADILGRWHYAPHGTVETYGPCLMAHADGQNHVRFLKPRSLWIPGLGRADTAQQPEQQSLLTRGAA